MIGLARKSGFAFTLSPGDWKLVRFEKHIEVAPQGIPCASCGSQRSRSRLEDFPHPEERRLRRVSKDEGASGPHGSRRRKSASSPRGVNSFGTS
jgi:hypothetical protein